MVTILNKTETREELSHGAAATRSMELIPAELHNGEQLLAHTKLGGINKSFHQTDDVIK